MTSTDKLSDVARAKLILGGSRRLYMFVFAGSDNARFNVTVWANTLEEACETVSRPKDTVVIHIVRYEGEIIYAEPITDYMS